MDFHGHINLQENEMRRMAFGSETDFPSSPVVGRTVFKGFVLYICVALNGATPVWIPITNTINTYKQTESVASASWTVTHNLTATTPIVQVYDENNQLIIPDSVVVDSDAAITVNFGAAITGKVVVMKSDEIPADGIGILSPDPVAYIQNFSSLATVVVKHNLGYYPIVRTFVGGAEVLPLNVVHDSIYQTTITFSSAQSGVIRFT